MCFVKNFSSKTERKFRIFRWGIPSFWKGTCYPRFLDEHEVKAAYISSDQSTLHGRTAHPSWHFSPLVTIWSSPQKNTEMERKNEPSVPQMLFLRA